MKENRFEQSCGIVSLSRFSSSNHYTLVLYKYLDPNWPPGSTSLLLIIMTKKDGLLVSMLTTLLLHASMVSSISS